jgi:hypothetical protein
MSAGFEDAVRTTTTTFDGGVVLQPFQVMKAGQDGHVEIEQHQATEGVSRPVSVNAVGA